MILNRSFYNRISLWRSLWNRYKLKRLIGEKVFKSFKLHKTEWPDKFYFYSPRFKRVPRFTGNVDLLRSWKDSKSCETICPTQAIRVTSDSFIIDDRGCIACGLCVEVSPPGLLEINWEPNLLHRF